MCHSGAKNILAQPAFREFDMALLMYTGPTTEAVVQQVSAAQVQVAPAATYRCVGCGESLHFNALSMTCRCIDECYTVRSEEGKPAEPA
jgi:beta-lactamase class D